MSSGCVGPKAGIPVILMPFFTIQKISALDHCDATSTRSGGDGLSPLPISPRSLPGAPWHGAHISPNSKAPSRTCSCVNCAGACNGVRSRGDRSVHCCMQHPLHQSAMRIGCSDVVARREDKDCGAKNNYAHRNGYYSEERSKVGHWVLTEFAVSLIYTNRRVVAKHRRYLDLACVRNDPSRTSSKAAILKL